MIKPTRIFRSIFLAVLFLTAPKGWCQGQIVPLFPTDSNVSGGPKFSLEFRDADIKDVLRAIGQENHVNIIIREEVKGKVTLSFKNVTLDEAFSAILKNQNLWASKTDSIVTVSRPSTSEGEEDSITRMIPVNYASAKELQDSVRGLMSKKGTVSVDGRSNTLIIKDSPEGVDRIANLVKSLDMKTPQVMIEARVVEASTNFTRELGIQWGGEYVNGNYLVNGGAFKTNSTDTFLTPLTGGIGASGGPFAVNLPATVGPGSGGSIGLSYIASNLLLDLQLSAMQDTGKGKILSNPKILTLDNKEARISSGTEILIPTATLVTNGTSTGGTATGSSATSGVTTIQAKLELVVTPHITPDHQILMHIKTEKKEPDYNRQIQNIPPLATRTAETDLMVKNGATVAIGGIYTKNESLNENGIPWLENIPILGWLFKKQNKGDQQAELIIFITPTEFQDGGPSEKIAYHLITPESLNEDQKSVKPGKE
ncbi:MAG: type IV pilus secretin PilQ [Nitrospirae bacterium]|nr:type IV pilus secretin PilQ [Nitrospirota bacterium]MBI3594349.1 type IV pilus secretin PilQ [Nitrospirota bacterium]